MVFLGASVILLHKIWVFAWSDKLLELHGWKEVLEEFFKHLLDLG